MESAKTSWLLWWLGCYRVACAGSCKGKKFSDRIMMVSASKQWSRGSLLRPLVYTFGARSWLEMITKPRFKSIQSEIFSNLRKPQWPTSLFFSVPFKALKEKLKWYSREKTLETVVAAWAPHACRYLQKREWLKPPFCFEQDGCWNASFRWFHSNELVVG